jgi:hypothetical protein
VAAQQRDVLASLNYNTSTPNRSIVRILSLNTVADVAGMIIVRHDVRRSKDVAGPDMHESISKVTSGFYSPGFFRQGLSGDGPLILVK